MRALRRRNDRHGAFDVSPKDRVEKDRQHKESRREAFCHLQHQIILRAGDLYLSRPQEEYRAAKNERRAVSEVLRADVRILKRERYDRRRQSESRD